MEKFYSYYFFKKNGYLLLDRVLTYQDCNDIMFVINKELGSLECEYTWNEKYRKNVRVPLEPEIKKIITKILNKEKLQKIWQNYTPNGILSESSVFLTYPKAGNQPWHRDINLKKGFANMITFGVALEDITEEMGPLELYPKSVNVSDERLEKIKDKYQDDYLENFNYKKRKIICKKGSLIIWNSKIIHRGSKNISNVIRPLFYFSFLEGNKPRPIGATYSLKSIYKNKIHINKLAN